MDPNQTRHAQQCWVLILLSQEQAFSLLALSHKYCFVGNAAAQNEFQYLSLYFLVLALISHMYNIAGGETPQWKHELKHFEVFFSMCLVGQRSYGKLSYKKVL